MEIRLARIAVNGFQNDFGSGPRASRASFEDVERITTPSMGYFIRWGRRVRRLKPRDLKWPSHIRAKSERYQTPCKTWGEARHYAAFVLGALIVVGIVAYCARQRWWELYVSELDTMTAGTAVSG
jgi:hypothetical protein